MKSLVVSAFGCLTLASVALFAEGPNNPANFEIAKKQMSEMAEKRMAVIKDFKSCVDAATDTNGLKECRKKEAQAMKALRPQKAPANRPGRGGDMNNTQSGMGAKSMM
jgi:hypothetical protein